MTVLDRIVADTRTLLSGRKSKVTIGQLEREYLFGRTPLDLAGSLRNEGLSIISEIKKASPSQGIIRPDFRPADFARGFADAGASAISVLTEPVHFHGSLQDLAIVREEVDLPILRKDFIVDVYQLFEARAFGADAVLLIAAVLDRPHLRDLLHACRELGLSALVEVYSFSELDRIDFDEVSILGVNNRDLHTFEVDVNHSLRVFAEVPEGIVRVSESGISRADQLVDLRDHGVDAVLIGETLMRADNPGESLSRLLEEMEEAAER